MPQFSANLGFLFTEHSLPDAIRAAADAGFNAVECHWPYDVPPSAVVKALQDTGLPMLGLNTVRGEGIHGGFGLSAVPGAEELARAAIDQAFDYADAIDAKAVHVMAGKTSAEGAEETFRANLNYACDRAGKSGRTVLIEPINQISTPGYFLHQTAQAASLITSLQRPELRLMFDCFHVGMNGEDVPARLKALLPLIGHIQFASVPDRKSPDQGKLDYPSFFDMIDDLGWSRPLGAEYLPDGSTNASLGWMSSHNNTPKT